MIFRDRSQAGQALARELGDYAHRPDVVVLGLPRGGVPVAAEVARALAAPLDVFVVRKLGVPGHEELAMGAIASGGTRVLNAAVLEHLSLSYDDLAETIAREEQELARREIDYRDDRPFPDLRGKVVILVDDGLATGSTMRAAARAVKQLAPREIVVGAPVAAAETCDELAREVDRVVCAEASHRFRAVGLHYEDFTQTTDAEVRRLLAEAAAEGNRG